MSNSENKQNIITEDELIEYILNVLYNSLDVNEKHLENDILEPTKLKFTPQQLEHLREMIISTNFAKNSLGFGKNGYMYLTAFGITQLKTFGTYRNYLKVALGKEAAITTPTHQNTTTSNQSKSSNSNNFNEFDDLAF